MAIGQRIKFFRNLRNLTQKQLGEQLGFSGKTSDVRIAQYESEARIPKNDLVNALATILQVSPKALDVPNIESYEGLMHTLFALEDIYGFKIDNLNGEICIRLDNNSSNASYLRDSLYSWYNEAKRFHNEEITKEEYDHWRYTYPQVKAQRTKESLDARRKEHQKSQDK